MLADLEFEMDDEYNPQDLQSKQVETWTCAKCCTAFVDPEDYPNFKDGIDLPAEPRLYWLNITEPLCSSCAITSGIPPIDKE